MNRNNYQNSQIKTKKSKKIKSRFYRFAKSCLGEEGRQEKSWKIKIQIKKQIKIPIKIKNTN